MYYWYKCITQCSFDVCYRVYVVEVQHLPRCGVVEVKLANRWKYSKVQAPKSCPSVHQLSIWTFLLILKCVVFSASSVFLPVDFLRNLFSSTLGLGSPDKVLDELTLEGVAQYIKSGKCESSPDSILLIHHIWLQ